MSDNIDDEALREVLSSGTYVCESSQQVEEVFKEMENKSIEDFLTESSNITNLHNQIGDCDTILERLMSMLLNFQDVLCYISTEITTLQKKSVSMSVQLTDQLFIEDIVIPQEMITVIMETPVTEKEFVIQLSVLNYKLNLARKLSFKETRLAADVTGLLDKLKVKAMAKIRKYLLEQLCKFFYDFNVLNDDAVKVEAHEDSVVDVPLPQVLGEIPKEEVEEDEIEAHDVIPVVDTVVVDDTDTEGTVAAPNSTKPQSRAEGGPLPLQRERPSGAKGNMVYSQMRLRQEQLVLKRERNKESQRRRRMKLKEAKAKTKTDIKTIRERNKERQRRWRMKLKETKAVIASGLLIKHVTGD